MFHRWCSPGYRLTVGSDSPLRHGTLLEHAKCAVGQNLGLGRFYGTRTRCHAITKMPYRFPK
jgi:hypothetical protein